MMCGGVMTIRLLLHKYYKITLRFLLMAYIMFHMDILSGLRKTSIAKLTLFCLALAMWCLSENRQENIFFIITASIIILCLTAKLIFIPAKIPKSYKATFLTILGLTDIILSVILLTLLYYTNGFDLKDFAALLITVGITILFVAEISLLIYFINSNIS